MRVRLSPVAIWAIAISAPATAVLVGWVVNLTTGTDIGFLPAVSAVLVAAALGGGWHGLVATIVAASTIALVTILFGDLGYGSLADPPRLATFVGTGLVTSALVESLHRARRSRERARLRERDARRAERALRARFELVMAAIGDGIAAVEPDGSVRLLNEAARRMLGEVDRVESLATLFASDEEGTPVTLPSGDRASSMLVYLAARSRWIELTSFPLDDSRASQGDEPGAVLILRDVTGARHRARLREAFLGVLSHELRTPITAIFGGATLLRGPESRLEPAARQEILADIIAESDRLTRLVEDLLVLARVEEGVEIGLEPILLQRLVPQIVDAQRQAADATPIEFRTQPGLPPVAGDETSLGQVLRNLLGNAAKYSPAGTPIEVELRAADDGVELLVSDRGRGITSAEASQVFDAFYRSRAAQRMASGEGLGLFVCRRLVEAMGGRIWARPRDGGGSEFGFALRSWELEPDEPVERSLVGVG